jgi:hypothetical protein
VSTSRFAPITSSLFARKGDAMPSGTAPKPSLFWTREPPPPVPPVDSARPDAAPPSPPQAGKPHRMMVMLTPAEFEKLGIAAVKKGVTRHQIVRSALDAHLDRLKREYGGCGCMAQFSRSEGGACPEGCGAG